jgi:hypothetical protein
MVAFHLGGELDAYAIISICDNPVGRIQSLLVNDALAGISATNDV